MKQLILLVLFFCVFTSNAQGIIRQQGCFGGFGNDQLSVDGSFSYTVSCKDGGRMVFGTTQSFYNNFTNDFDSLRDSISDLIALKFDKLGNLVWKKNLGLPGLEKRIVLRQSADSSSVYILYGLYYNLPMKKTIYNGVVHRERILKKLEDDGTFSWSKSLYHDSINISTDSIAEFYSTNGEYQGGSKLSNKITLDSSGNLLVEFANQMINTERSVRDARFDSLYYMYLNPAGNIIWKRSYSPSQLVSQNATNIKKSEFGYPPVVLSNKFLFLSTNEVSNELELFSLSLSNGSIMNQKKFDSTYYLSIAALSNGNLLLTGEQYTSSTPTVATGKIIYMDLNLNVNYTRFFPVTNKLSKPMIGLMLPSNQVILQVIIDSVVTFPSLATIPTHIVKFNYVTNSIIWDKVYFAEPTASDHRLYSFAGTINTSTILSANRLIFLSGTQSSLIKIDNNTGNITVKVLDSVLLSTRNYKISSSFISLSGNKIFMRYDGYDPTFQYEIHGLRIYDSTLSLIFDIQGPELKYQGNLNLASYLTLTAENDLLGVYSIASVQDYCDLGGNDIAVFLTSGNKNYIEGKVYIDLNNNNQYNAGTDQLVKNGFATSSKGSVKLMSYIDANSRYSNAVDTGTYITTYTDAKNYFTMVPVSHSTSHSNHGFRDTADFALHPKGIIKDLRVTLINRWVTRPGFDNSYVVQYVNEGTTAISNPLLTVVLDGRLGYNSSSPSPTSISGDTLKWNLATLNPAQSGQVTIFFTANIPPLLNDGDSLLSTAKIFPVIGDTLPIDNSYTLTDISRNAFDPNDKNVESNSMLTPSQVANGDYITYRVRFQNTGSFYATNIIVRDTLDNNLDWNTLQVIASSFPGLQTTVSSNNIVEFKFNNINLTPSEWDEASSHGYVVFKIKPKSTLTAGNTVKNTAHIFFDYNVPIKTNTAVAKVISVTATINKQQRDGEILVYPNPSSDNVWVDFTAAGSFMLSLSITDATGSIVFTQTYSHREKTQLQIPGGFLASGMYTIQISGNNGIWNKKVLYIKP